MSHEEHVVAGYEIYPRRYFTASPSWFAWNKLTVRDIHALRDEPDFRGQNIYFHLNHPIQYVAVTGMAVQIEVGGGEAAGRLCFVKLDDGTQHILNIKILRRPVEESAGQVFPSNTMIDNLDLVMKLGKDPALFVGEKELTLGSVVRARGTLETYRGAKQMVLDKLRIIATTSEEVKLWRDTLDWKQNVLGHPWVLSEDERRRLDEKLLKAQRDAEKRTKLKQQRHAHRNRKRQHDEDKAEAKRARLEIAYNEGALSGSERVRTPWP